MKLFTKIILLVFSLSLTLLAKDVATITGVNGKAFIQRDGVKISVNIGDKLEEKDTVITNDKSKVQIIFTDETIITIGKNSNFSIGEYLFEENEEPVAKFSMIKGAMRTITGKIGKIAPEKFTVTAKTATIGIRGTNFSVVVGENDNTQVYCTFGAISVNVKGTQHIVNQGFFIIVAPNGRVNIKPFKAKDLDNVKKKFAKKTTKTGKINGDSVPSNEAIVDNTTENYDNLIIKNITNSLAEAELSDADIDLDLDSNLADVISGYTMNDAVYNGTYSVTSVEGSPNSLYPGDTGTAKLEVDFGNDTIELTLNQIGMTDVVFKDNSSISGTNFSATQYEVPEGQANGTFSGDTGNEASGTYKYLIDSGVSASGKFNVTSTQTLK